MDDIEEEKRNCILMLVVRVVKSNKTKSEQGETRCNIGTTVVSTTTKEIFTE